MKKPIGYGKLRWWNLRQNKCPKCGVEFFKNNRVQVDKENIYCICGFFISTEKYQKIVNDMNVKDVDQKLDELEHDRSNWL